MRCFILLALAVALCSALPQEDAPKPRMRGPRRFSLATPGLQSVNRPEANAEVPEAPKAAQTPWSANESVAPRRTLNRGTSLRRGRPTLIPLEETTTVASARGTFRVSDDAPQPSASRKDTGRSGLQLRRPRTRTTTTTTTEAPAPVEEQTPIVKEEILPKKELKTKEEKVEKKPVAEAKKTVEELPEEAAEPEPEPEPETDENQKEAPVEVATTEAPKPKLRPIPIKLGGRGQGAAAPRPQKVSDEETAPEATAAAPAQRHRFSASADSGSSLRPKTRGREATSSSAAEAPAAAAPSAPRVRRPIPQQKQSPRVSSRTAAVEEPIAADTETETSFPNLDEIKNILNKVTLPSTTTKAVPTTTSTTTIASTTTTTASTTTTTLASTTSSTTSTTPAPATTAMSQEPKRIRLNKNLPMDETLLPNLNVEEAENPTAFTDYEEDAPPILSQRFATEDEPPILGQRFSTDEEVIVKPQRQAINFGGSDLVFKGGEVQVTQIGTLEDTPAHETRTILQGLGSRRRGLGRPSASSRRQVHSSAGRKSTPSVQRPSTKKVPFEPISHDVVYDYSNYDELYEEEPIRKL